MVMLITVVMLKAGVMLMLKWLLILGSIVFSSLSQGQFLPGAKAKLPGDLELIIVASGTAGYIQKWLNTPAKHGVTIKRLKVAKPNQLIVIAFLMTGLTGDANGDYKYTVNSYILGPDGEPIWGERDYAAGQGTLPNRPAIIMADPALDLTLDSTDPVGKYSIFAELTDHVSGEKATSRYTIMFDK